MKVRIEKILSSLLKAAIVVTISCGFFNGLLCGCHEFIRARNLPGISLQNLLHFTVAASCCLKLRHCKSCQRGQATIWWLHFFVSTCPASCPSAFCCMRIFCLIVRARVLGRYLVRVSGADVRFRRSDIAA